MPPLIALDSPDLYTVGWIAALSLERAAAIAMLDERHGRPRGFVQSPTDNNIYTWGRIGEHNIVIASLAAGIYGTTSAASTALPLIHSFPQVRIGLLVGIGAGVARPDQGRDIRLGDVAVSQPGANTGGVVQYDLIKAKQGLKLENKAFLNMPPLVVLNAISAIQAEHELRPSKISEYLEDLVRNYPGRGENYTHQGAENDRLFQTNDPDREIQRDKRKSIIPKIHYGIIASGNTLFKDAVQRDEILDRIGHDCICFEMEAAGLMNSFPCVVIRGISDYADSHKNDQWQRYAAATAAAYAKELLEYIPGPELQQTEQAIKLRDITRKIDDIHYIAKETRGAIGSLSSDKEFWEIRKWLSSSDPSTNLNQATDKRYTGTGSWFLESVAFRDWEARKERHLWLHGIPGCGKTILCSTVVAHLLSQKGKSSAVLYFFFDFKDSSKWTLDSLIRSIVSQLFSIDERCRDEVADLYYSLGKGYYQPNTKSLISTFQKMLSHISTVYLVIDALDESSTGEQLLSWMREMASLESSNLSFFATSRKERYILSSLEKWICGDNIVPIQQDPVDFDIRLYINGSLGAENGFRRWRSNPSVLEEIKTSLMEKANGMFRWAACQLDALEKCLDYPKLKKALQSLPRDLHETYSRILSNIHKNHRNDIILILQLLVYSERPVQIEEAVDAVAVNLSKSPQFDPEYRMPLPEEISDVCSSLVSIITTKTQDNTSMKIMQLAHFSVKEYFLSESIEDGFKGCMDEVYARGSILKVCLAYMSHVDTSLDQSKLRRKFPLWDYAASWMYHAFYVESKEEYRRSILGFFLEQQDAYRLWSFFMISRDIPPLYHACEGGLLHTVRWMADNGVDINARVGTHKNALEATCDSGMVTETRREETVKVLLEAGANVNNGGCWEDTKALHLACRKGARGTVRLLLKAGAEVNAVSRLRGSPLEIAALNGFESIARLLLSFGADVDLGGRHATPLDAAVNGRHVAMARLLLENKADPSAQCFNISTTVNEESHSYLFKATQREDVEMIGLLLDYGADTDVKSGCAFDKKDALWEAVDRHDTRIIQKLLAAGADANSSNSYGYTALEMASKRGRISIVTQLLSAGANLETRGKALKEASSYGHKDIVRLLARGFGAQVHREAYGSALAEACRHKQRHIVRILIAEGADVNFRNSRYNTTILETACWSGDMGIVCILLQSGANPDRQTLIPGRSLRAAWESGNGNLLRQTLSNIFEGRQVKQRK